MAHAKSSGELLGEIAKAAGLAPTGAEFVHALSGGRYRVAMLSIREDTLGVDVIYRSVETGLAWTRPLSAFLGRFERVPDEQATNPVPLPPRPVLTEADREMLRAIIREEYRGTENTGAPLENVVVIPLPDPDDGSADAADVRAHAALVRKLAAKPWLAEDALAVLQDTATLYKGCHLGQQSARILADLDAPATASREYDISHFLYHRPRLAAWVLAFCRLVWPTVVESDETPTRVRYLISQVRRLLAAYPERKGGGRDPD